MTVTGAFSDEQCELTLDALNEWRHARVFVEESLLNYEIDKRFGSEKSRKPKMKDQQNASEQHMKVMSLLIACLKFVPITIWFNLVSFVLFHDFWCQ